MQYAPVQWWRTQMKADYYKQMETVQDEYKLVQGAAWEGAGTE